MDCKNHTIKKRRGNLPPNPIPLLVMLFLGFAVLIHNYLYPNAFSTPSISNMYVTPNIWDFVYVGFITIVTIIVLINVVYSLYSALRYGGP